MLRTIYDPEMPVNIYDLGLIYGNTFKFTQTLGGCVTGHDDGWQGWGKVPAAV